MCFSGHSWTCPARDAHCYKCGHKGHYAKKCYSLKTTKSAKRLARDRQRKQEFISRKCTQPFPFTGVTQNELETIFDPAATIKEELRHFKKQLNTSQKRISEQKRQQEQDSKRTSWLKEKLEVSMRQLQDVTKERDHLQALMNEKAEKEANELRTVKVKLQQEVQKAKARDEQFKKMKELKEDNRILKIQVECEEYNRKHLDEYWQLRYDKQGAELTQQKDLLTEQLHSLQAELKEEKQKYIDLQEVEAILSETNKKMGKELRITQEELEALKHPRKTSHRQHLYQNSCYRTHGNNRRHNHSRNYNSQNTHKPVYFATYSGRTSLKDL